MTQDGLSLCDWYRRSSAFSIRQLHSNTVRNAFSALAIKMQILIIQTLLKISKKKGRIR